MDNTIDLPRAIARRNQAQVQNKKRLRHSAFFVTLNSNQSVHGMAAAEADQFKKRFFSVCKDVLKNQPSLWVRIKESGVVYGPEVIKGLQIGPAVIEIGNQNGRIHIHCIVIISHYTKVHIDCDALQVLISEKMNYPDGKSIYANSAWFEYRVRDQSDLSRILDYMKKEQSQKIAIPGDSNTISVEDSMELDQELDLPVENSTVPNK